MRPPGSPPIVMSKKTFLVTGPVAAAMQRTAPRREAAALRRLPCCLSCAVPWLTAVEEESFLTLWGACKEDRRKQMSKMWLWLGVVGLLEAGWQVRQRNAATRLPLDLADPQSGGGLQGEQSARFGSFHVACEKASEMNPIT